MARRILLIGATGLIGRLLADRLAGGTAEVHALVRRPTGRNAPRWTESVAPAEQWPGIIGGAGGDVAISTLGTTWRAAGSEEAFRAVDQQMVLSFAQAARDAGVPHMIMVSSVGAAAGARTFYLRVKGESEQALRAFGFPRLDLVRPGLLRGDRGPERRTGERIAIALSPLTNLVLRGRLGRFAAIDAAKVAAAIARLTSEDEPGIFVHHNRELLALARA